MDNRYAPYIFGMRMYLAREQQSLSLRELAEKTKVSYSYLNRIEKGLVTPADKVSQVVSKVLKLKFFEDKQQDKVLLQKVYPDIVHLSMYAEYNKVKALYRTLQADAAYYLKSPVFLQTYLALLTAMISTRVDYEKVHEYHQICSWLYPYMRGYDQVLFDVLDVLYMILNRQGYKAWHKGKKLLLEIEDSHLKGRLLYALGVTVVHDYHYYHHAKRLFEEAKSIFNRHMNYHRANRADIQIQSILLYLHHFEQYEEAMKRTQSHAVAMSDNTLYYRTKMNEVRYAMMQKNFEQAITLMEPIQLNETTYYLYHAYALLKLNRTMEALNIIQKYRQQQGLLTTKTEAMAFDTLEYGLTHQSADPYIKKLKQFCDAAHHHRDFILIQIASDLLDDMLVKHRRYKEAQKYAQKYLDVLYALIQRKEDNHERLSESLNV